MSLPGKALARRLGRAVLLFLEVIGLREGRHGREETQFARFRLHYKAFRTLLAANDSFLSAIADLEERGRRSDPFDTAFVKRRVVRALADVHQMVDSLDEISGLRYLGLRGAFERIAAGLTATVQDASPTAQDVLILEQSETFATHADLAGGKMANLGAVRNAVGLPTPDGFTITTEGFYQLARAAADAANGAEHPGGAAALPDTADSRRSRLLATPVPPPMAEAILAAYDRLAARAGAPVPVAIRSSALGEDGTHSFAGQFLTVLNVWRDGLLDAYRNVVASLYSPEAAHYRQLHGISEASATMAVGVVRLVDAAVSGIAYSRDPQAGNGDVLIQAVRGLGSTLADGAAVAESVRVSRDGGTPAVTRTVSRQDSVVVCDAAGGVLEELLGDGRGAEPCLLDDEARQIARWALQLESHFGGPQDIEWALDAERRPVVLQSRPLRVSGVGARTRPPVEGFTLLVRGGETACAGAGTGIAVRMGVDDDLEAFPEGGVLVARRSSPRFIRLMSKARAIVTDAGSVTGHMATLAREFRVPALLGTGTATRDIPAGARITVDAGAGFVYLGEVPGLEGDAAVSEHESASGRVALPTASAALLSQVVPQIVPLNLIDARSGEFTPEACRTLHDLARFIHEKSYAEMFRMGEQLGDARAGSFLLDVFLPIDLYVIDLGGGVAAPAQGRKVKPEQITSRPLGALLAGMLDRRLPRFGPKPIDAGGLFSLMMRHAVNNPESDQTFRDPCYAIVSDAYLNYTARVGYHFGVVDSYCSPSTNRNYITFRFKGGAADGTRRGRRARSIAGVLREYGFWVEVAEDEVAARLGKATGEEIAAKLEMLGRLLQFFRQVDASMSTESAVRQFQDAFLRDDFRLEGNGKKPA